MGNINLVAAKRAKNDEFYTRREDIENELMHYRDHFTGKTVYCNCDDPVTSEFWKFFQRNFSAWGLKRLIATHYEPDAVNYSYMIEMNPGDAWDGTPVRKLIQSNGDFRSAAAGLRQTVDDIPGIVRESVQEIADRSHLKYSTVWAQVTRDMCLSSEQFYDLLQQHLFESDKRVSRFTHNTIQHIGRDDCIASIWYQLNQ